MAAAARTCKDLRRVEESAPCRLIGGLIAAAALTLSGPASAQLAGNLALQSDFRLRGVSVSDLRPTLALTLGDDFANGVYLGGSAIGQDPSHGGPRMLGHMEYLGFAARRRNGVAWDVGVNNQDLSVHARPPIRVRYSEAYFGVSDGDISGRLYISPNYMRPGVSVAYLELNRVWRVETDWRFAGHVGVFQPLTGTSGTTVRRTRLDGRFDVVRRLGPVELDLGLTAASPAAQPEPRRSRPGFVLAATAFF
ncbi:MAG TPA: TorF family putative porin [Phenylobacterium sp.]